MPAHDHARALSNIDARTRSYQHSAPTGARALNSIVHPTNVPRPQIPAPLPPKGDPEAYALARRDQIMIRDGVDLTQATITFGRKEPDAYHRYREAVNAKVNPAATSILGAQGQASIRLFESKVIDLRRADPTLSAEDAISRVSAAHPDLARAYTVALSVPVIGGVSMVSA